MKSILREEKADSSALISGVILFTVLAVVFGIVIMIYANTSPTILAGSFHTATAESFNNSGPPNTWTALANTIGSTGGTTAYSISIYNATETLVQGTDYNVTVANSSVLIIPAKRNLTYSATYAWEDSGASTVRSVNSNTYQGFNIGSVIPIVIAASLIITIVLGFAGMILGRRGE